MTALQNSKARTIVVMHGDQTGEELLKEALRVLVPEVIGIELDFQHFDLSLEKRRATKNQVVREAADAMLQDGLGMKAATITPTESERRRQPECPPAGIHQRDGHPAHRAAPAARPAGGRRARPDLHRPHGRGRCLRSEGMARDHTRWR